MVKEHTMDKLLEIEKPNILKTLEECRPNPKQRSTRIIDAGGKY